MASGDVDVKITSNNAHYGASFDGVDDYIEIPHHENQLGRNLLNGFTISAWINPKSIGEGTRGRILDKSTAANGDNGFQFNMLSSGGIKAMFKINVGTAATSAELSLNLWTHVLITVSSGQLANYYMNGVLSGVANQNLVQTISTITTTNAMRIGNRSTATDATFDGVIRDVRMWNKVLTADEIAKVYANGNVKEGLIGRWKLNGNSNDYSNYGNHGTDSGVYYTIRDDAIASAMSGQRLVAGLSGTYLMAGLKGGQIVSAAITP